MSLKSELVGLLVSPVSGAFEKGTAYPTRDGVAITAAHVIPDIQNYNEKQDKVSYILWPTEKGNKSFIQRILFPVTDADFDSGLDVAVIECSTPVDLSAVVLCKNTPDYPELWHSFGYPRAAEKPELDKHHQKAAAGNYLSKVHNQSFQELETESFATDDVWWKGMSGAPVFKANSSHLTGVFIEGSPVYKKEGEASQQIFNGLLKAASIAHLLDNPNFAEAVYGKEYSEYQQEHEKKLRDIWDATPAFKAKLPSCDDVLAQLKINPVKCIQDLKKQCKGLNLAECKNEVESLFYLLLSQVDMSCSWQGKHFHELEVSTRLLAELSVAKLYGVEPKFEQTDQLVGQHVIPASQKELGFDFEDAAEDQANSVAYAIYKKWGNEGLSKNSLKNSPQHYDEVNEQLLLSREDDGAVYRFELNEKSEEAQNHALMDEKVRKYIHEKLLPDLPIVLYDRSPESVFPDEGKLQTHVRSFVKQIILA
ncbi:S1 family peptidase [Leucothrix pacifica]|uniref:Serine protease n=1 Tax=Leucothrix pacifica TaxID=1247513 RepID=A0A317CKD2_9GAMM|nr:serine protease [Leucothrix pacifica]PWQ98631.1 hypothetical protein DKW60_07805 [Leucothrix pacifica]